MNDSDYGYQWDVSFNDQKDVIFIDTGEDVQVYLTLEDLDVMYAALKG